jgi:hypothetical protein
MGQSNNPVLFSRGKSVSETETLKEVEELNFVLRLVHTSEASFCCSLGTSVSEAVSLGVNL